MRFTNARVRILVLVKLVLFLVFFYVAANFAVNSSLRKRNFIIRNMKSGFSLRHVAKAKSNSTQKPLNFTKRSKSYNFKPALERPESYASNGLGELGVKVKLNNLTAEEKSKEDTLSQQYGINQFLSQKISLHRTLKDPRPLQ